MSEKDYEYIEAGTERVTVSEDETGQKIYYVDVGDMPAREARAYVYAKLDELIAAGVVGRSVI